MAVNDVLWEAEQAIRAQQRQGGVPDLDDPELNLALDVMQAVREQRDLPRGESTHFASELAMALTRYEMATRDGVSWGWCPDCGGRDGRVQLRGTQWSYCLTHQRLWAVEATTGAPDPPISADSIATLATFRVSDGWIPTPAMLARTFVREG